MKTRFTLLLLSLLPFALNAKKFREYGQMTTIDDNSAFLVSPPEGYDFPGTETSYWLTLAQIRDRNQIVTGDWTWDGSIIGNDIHAPDELTRLYLSGGSTGNTGANIYLNGASHASGPDIVFRNGTTVYGSFNDGTGNLEVFSGLTTHGLATINGTSATSMNVINAGYVSGGTDGVTLKLLTPSIQRTNLGYSDYWQGSILLDYGTNYSLIIRPAGLTFRDGNTATNYFIYHEGNKPTAADTGAWPAFTEVVSTSSNTTAVVNKLYINTRYYTNGTTNVLTLTLPSPSGNSGKIIGFACKYDTYLVTDDHQGWALSGHINGRSSNTDFQGFNSPSKGLLWCDGTTWILLSTGYSYHNY